jgi:hypothetical protein
MGKIEEDWNNYFKFTNYYKKINFTSFKKKLQLVIDEILERIHNTEVGVTVYKPSKKPVNSTRQTSFFV